MDRQSSPPALPPELLLPPKRRIVRNRNGEPRWEVMQAITLLVPLGYIYAFSHAIRPDNEIDRHQLMMIIDGSCVLLMMALEWLLWAPEIRARKLAESGDVTIGKITYLREAYGGGRYERPPSADVEIEGHERMILLTNHQYKLLCKERKEGARFEPILFNDRYANFYRFHRYQCKLPRDSDS